MRDPAMPERRLCSILRSRDIRGIIPGACAELGYKPGFEWDAFCWTSMTISIDSPPLDLVNSDHFGDIYSALHQARRLGYRRAALFVRKVADDRLRRAWLGACLSHVVDVNPGGPIEPYRENDYNPAAIRAWPARNTPYVLIGVFHTNTVQRLSQVAPRIPDELGLISVTIPQHDDTITGYRENRRVMEIEAVRHLAGQPMRNEVGVPR